MNSKIDQEVLDELVAMLEDHIAGGLKPESAMEPESEEKIPGVEDKEGGEVEISVEKEMPEDDEDLKALMEMYSKG